MSGNIFNQYAPSASASELVAEKEPYQAVVRGKERQIKLLMVGRKGEVIGMPSYAYYMDLVCESHQNISLIFTQNVYLIQGRNLLQLLPLLQDDRARSLRCFNGNHYSEPAPDDPFIASIERTSLQDAVS